MPRTGVNVKEECIRVAFEILKDHEPESLSLREVARRLKITHQAPYRHFKNRDHLLAAVIARAFSSFADALEAVPTTDDPGIDLDNLGRSYLAYADQHALHYKLMFSTPLASLVQYEGLMDQAMRAFHVLLRTIARVSGRNDEQQDLLDALSVWSMVHGLAAIRQTGILSVLQLPSGAFAIKAEEIMCRMSLDIGKSKPG